MMGRGQDVTKGYHQSPEKSKPQCRIDSYYYNNNIIIIKNNNIIFIRPFRPQRGASNSYLSILPPSCSGAHQPGWGNNE